MEIINISNKGYWTQCFFCSNKLAVYAICFDDDDKNSIFLCSDCANELSCKLNERVINDYDRERNYFKKGD